MQKCAKIFWILFFAIILCGPVVSFLVQSPIVLLGIAAAYYVIIAIFLTVVLARYLHRGKRNRCKLLAICTGLFLWMFALTCGFFLWGLIRALPAETTRYLIISICGFVVFLLILIGICATTAYKGLHVKLPITSKLRCTLPSICARTDFGKRKRGSTKFDGEELIWTSFNEPLDTAKVLFAYRKSSDSQSVVSSYLDLSTIDDLYVREFANRNGELAVTETHPFDELCLECKHAYDSLPLSLQPPDNVVTSDTGRCSEQSFNSARAYRDGCDLPVILSPVALNLKPNARSYEPRYFTYQSQGDQQRNASSPEYGYLGEREPQSPSDIAGDSGIYVDDQCMDSLKPVNIGRSNSFNPQCMDPTESDLQHSSGYHSAPSLQTIEHVEGCATITTVDGIEMGVYHVGSGKYEKKGTSLNNEQENEYEVVTHRPGASHGTNAFSDASSDLLGSFHVDSLKYNSSNTNKQLTKANEKTEHRGSKGIPTDTATDGDDTGSIRSFTKQYEDVTNIEADKSGTKQNEPGTPTKGIIAHPSSYVDLQLSTIGYSTSTRNNIDQQLQSGDSANATNTWPLRKCRRRGSSGSHVRFESFDSEQTVTESIHFDEPETYV